MCQHARSGDLPITTRTLLSSYCAATGAALVTALGLNAAGVMEVISEVSDSVFQSVPSHLWLGGWFLSWPAAPPTASTFP